LRNQASLFQFDDFAEPAVLPSCRPAVLPSCRPAAQEENAPNRASTGRTGKKNPD
jgi:hypothetical protein